MEAVTGAEGVVSEAAMEAIGEEEWDSHSSSQYSALEVVVYLDF